MAETPLVNLFIVGAMKCGTTAMHKVLGQHPEIAMSREKEPCHFVAPEDLAIHWPSQLEWQDLTAYHALFETTPETRIRGEASTLYGKLPLFQGVARRIFDYNPNARILYLMRNPFDRLVSHFLQEYQRGQMSGPIEEAAEREVRLIAYGDYASQLAPYFALFPRPQIHTIVSERTWTDPQHVMDELTDWLGVSRFTFHFGMSPQDRKLTKPQVGRPRSLLNRRRLEWLYKSWAWYVLGKFAPRSIKAFGRRLIYKDFVAKEGIVTNRLIDLVRHPLEAQVAATRALIGAPIPEWDSLFGSNRD